MTTRTFEASTGIQRRTIGELRVGAGNDFSLEGYAAKYNSLSKNLGGFREIINPGAFSRSIRQNAKVVALFNHDPSNILGATKSGTLQISEDSHGLKFRCQLDRNQQAHKDLWAATNRGDISEMSFSFTVPAGGDSWEDGIDPETNQPCAMRTLKDVDLMDVSPVVFAAYSETGVAARSHAVTVNQTHGLKSAIAVLRRAAQAMVRQFKPARPECLLRGDSMSQMDFASIGEHLQKAHEFAEAAHAYSDTARDMLDAWDDCGDDGDQCDDVLRAAHRAAHVGLEMACDSMATACLRHSMVMDKKKKAKK